MFSKKKKSDVGWVERGYVLQDYSFTDFYPRTRVLDIGCGEGEQLKHLINKGHEGIAIGLDISWKAVKECKEKGIPVVCAKAENLPFKNNSFNGIICKVTLPYTNEAVVTGNITKATAPGGTIELCCHGLGYYFYYLLFHPSLFTRIYSILTIVNTWIYIFTGKRWRNTIYQSKKRMNKYFEIEGLQTEKISPSKSFLGMPVFIYYRLKRMSG